VFCPVYLAGLRRRRHPERERLTPGPLLAILFRFVALSRDSAGIVWRLQAALARLLRCACRGFLPAIAILADDFKLPFLRCRPLNGIPYPSAGPLRRVETLAPLRAKHTKLPRIGLHHLGATGFTSCQQHQQTSQPRDTENAAGLHGDTPMQAGSERIQPVLGRGIPPGAHHRPGKFQQPVFH